MIKHFWNIMNTFIRQCTSTCRFWLQFRYEGDDYLSFFQFTCVGRNQRTSEEFSPFSAHPFQETPPFWRPFIVLSIEMFWIWECMYLNKLMRRYLVTVPNGAHYNMDRFFLLTWPKDSPRLTSLLNIALIMLTSDESHCWSGCSLLASETSSKSCLFNSYCFSLAQLEIVRLLFKVYSEDCLKSLTDLLDGVAGFILCLISLISRFWSFVIEDILTDISE